ncbi:LysR family transcriptional regulator [Sphingomonas glacialis]|uniref:LysR family transcriptional regulator n=1 Tax=Sphingomonas glacialis TaxID=658225 RepID=A0A502FCR1_9SPHN|nr:LysR family transcriptional regulator [Sphingomonas glacialis]TPG47162.1 LysR family transcriptional regulator [Sphingomonas glacialis]
MSSDGRPSGAHLATRLQAISLRQLRFFAELADGANFSRAAERMAVSQPALSAAIRQIEALLDLTLFDRTTHRVALTDVGAALLPHVRRLLITADNAFADMAEAAVRQRTIVRMGAIPSAIPAVASQLAAFKARSTEPIDVTLCDGKSDSLLQQLHSGMLDLVVGVHPVEEPTLESIPLIEDALLLVVPTNHAFAAAKAISWSDLGGNEIVHFGGGSIGEVTSAAMRQNNLTPSARYRVDQVDSLFGLVRAGLAVGIMPRLYTMGLGWDGVALVPLVKPRIVRRLVLLSRRGLAAEHPAGAQFAREICIGLGAALMGSTRG